MDETHEECIEVINELTNLIHGYEELTQKSHKAFNILQALIKEIYPEHPTPSQRELLQEASKLLLELAEGLKYHG